MQHQTAHPLNIGMRELVRPVSHAAVCCIVFQPVEDQSWCANNQQAMKPLCHALLPAQATCNL